MVAQLQLLDVHKRFDSVQALDSVSLSIETGKIHALLGENGAGKTTLMRIAFGMIRADRGVMIREGKSVVIDSPRAARALGIGMVHQHFTSVPELTVAENVALAAGWQVRPKTINRRVTGLCRDLGLLLDPESHAGSLPVALKQRLEIVKALASPTSVLLLDEPTAVLTPAEADNLMVFLRGFASRGGAVVLITHKLTEALTAADRITVLRKGRVTWDGEAGDQSAESLTRHMIGDTGPSQASAARTRPKSSEPVVFVQGLSVSAEPGHGSGLVEADLKVHAGEIVGLAAVEGNGQRELLRAVAGIREPASGFLTVEGAAAFVPEDRTTEGLIPTLTLTENLTLGLGGKAEWVGDGPMHIVDWHRGNEACRELLDSFSVAASGPDSLAASLSGGNQQKLILARALALAPAAILAENPTRGLDVGAALEIHSRLKEAANGGTAVVFYSSDLDEVIELADRIVVLRQGRTIEVVGVRDRVAIGAMMLGSDISASGAGR